MSQPTRIHVVVHGHVQGVFFRDTVRRSARDNGVSGWVRNCRDGTLEAVFEGPPDAVSALVELCRTGPPDARVERIEATQEEPEGLSGFSLR